MSEPSLASDKPFVVEVQAGNSYYWCACGQSNNQPFCDGSHQGSEFVPKEVEITEAKKVAWCGCKQSANGAFCDGTHAKL